MTPLDLFLMLEIGTIPLQGIEYELILDTQSMVNFHYANTRNLNELDDILYFSQFDFLVILKVAIATLLRLNINVNACCVIVKKNHTCKRYDSFRKLTLHTIDCLHITICFSFMLLHVYQMFSLSAIKIYDFAYLSLLCNLKAIGFEPVLDSITISYYDLVIYLDPLIFSNIIRYTKHCDIKKFDNSFIYKDYSFLKRMIKNLPCDSYLKTLQLPAALTGPCICDELRDVPLFCILNASYEKLVLPACCSLKLYERSIKPVGESWTQSFDMDGSSNFYRAFVTFLLCKDELFSLDLVIFIFSFLPREMTKEPMLFV